MALASRPLCGLPLSGYMGHLPGADQTLGVNFAMQKKISKEEMTKQKLQRDKEMDEQINVNQIRVCNDDETVAALPGFLREKVQDEVRMKIKSGVMRITSEGLLELVPKNKDLKLPPRVPGQIREEDHACQGSTDGGGGVGASAVKTEKMGQAAQDPS